MTDNKLCKQLYLGKISYLVLTVNPMENKVSVVSKRYLTSPMIKMYN